MNTGKYEKKACDLVDAIKEKVSEVSPIYLLNFIVSMSNMAMCNKKSEIEYSEDEVFTNRAIEYVQSVLVSTETKDNIFEVDDEKKYHEILSLVIELYKSLAGVLLEWLQKNKSKGLINDNEAQYIMESSINGLIRGNRYQRFQIPYYDELLKTQEEAIKAAFDVTHEEIVHGLEKLEYNLSKGWSDAVNDIQKIDFEELMSTEESEKIEEARAIVNNLFSLGLYDVKKATGWPDKFIHSLAYEVGGETDFYKHSEFNGLPFWRMPVQEKPFVKIDKIVYCFSHYILFDNFYRCLQRVLANCNSKNSDSWQKNQKKASEQLVASLFQKLLPGAKIHSENYYPQNESLKNLFENDLIIEYKDALLIVEIKAGAFTYTPAITDYKAHVKSFDNIVNSADNQCIRTLNYLKSRDIASIYDNKREEKAAINLNQFSQIYSFCVSLDDFNEFAAKAEKVNLIRIELGTIVISIDDLWVYAEYFNEPYEFMHFLKQRKDSTKIKALLLNDELDHLGLYIEHNMYPLTVQNELENTDADAIYFSGYRERLDNYFGSYEKNKRPEQEIEKEFKRILELVQAGTSIKPLEFSNFLMDLSQDAKSEFVEKLLYVLQRQRIIGGIVPFFTFGDIRYCLFVEDDIVSPWREQKKRDYVSSILIESGADWYYMITIKIDEKDSINDVEYCKMTKEEIPLERKDEFQETIHRIKQLKVESYKKESGKKKIGRNDPCPCGSGKKYKYCCGR